MGMGERWMGSAGVPGGCLHKDQTPCKGCCSEEQAAVERTATP